MGDTVNRQSLSSSRNHKKKINKLRCMCQTKQSFANRGKIWRIRRVWSFFSAKFLNIWRCDLCCRLPCIIMMENDTFAANQTGLLFLLSNVVVLFRDDIALLNPCNMSCWLVACFFYMSYMVWYFYFRRKLTFY